MPDTVDDELPLARLLAMAFRVVTDQLHQELAAIGHVLRPAHGFALVTIGDEGATASRLAAVLGITKQGTAKLVDGLTELGYVARQDHAGDGRARLIVLTDRGRSLLQESAAIQRRIEVGWRELLGAHDVQVLRDGLDRAVTDAHGGGYPPLRPVW